MSHPLSAPADGALGHHFPFAALVGQEQLKTALCVAAANPAVGGVLVRGEKGTAKSTAARALAALLPPLRVVAGCPFHCDPAGIWHCCPHCVGAATSATVEIPVPFVTLPLGATEDRVVGTLDVERALHDGRRAFEPGLLAAAHRGVLYIDEVNLLPDHLVDVLLDAAAMGVNTVQREGISVVHPARFTLIGTMNPEEGELRPQFLDRFGLSVDVTSPREPADRAEVVRRRIAFDGDPGGFAERWHDEEAQLAERITQARECLPAVRLDDATLDFIARLCCQVEVDGLRADIAIHRTACTLAALAGDDAVTLAHVRTAAELVLPHRTRRRPFDQPALDRERLDDHFARAQAEAEPPSAVDRSETTRPRGDGPSATADDQPTPGDRPDSGARSEAAPGAERRRPGEVTPDSVPPRAAPRAAPRVSIESSATSAGRLRGRRNAGATGGGRYVRAVPDMGATDVAVDATLRAAVLRSADAGGAVQVAPADLHRKVREGRTGTLVLFLLDASGSMAARQRVEATRGAVLGFLTDAYQRRDRVALIAFRGPQAEVVIPPTNSIELARRALERLPTGGRTPLAHALALGAEMIQRVRREDPGQIVLLVVVSDGKANVSLPATTGDPWQQAAALAREVARAGVATLVLEGTREVVSSGRTEELALLMEGRQLSVDELSGHAILRLVESARAASSPGSI